MQSGVMCIVLVLYVAVAVGLAAVVKHAENSKDDILIKRLKQDLLHKNEDYYYDNDVDLNNNNNNNNNNKNSTTTLGRAGNEPNKPSTHGKRKHKLKRKKDKSINFKNSLTQEREKGVRRHVESEMSIEEFVNLLTTTSTKRANNQNLMKTISRTTKTAVTDPTTWKPYTFNIYVPNQLDDVKNDVQAPRAPAITKTINTTKTKITTTTTTNAESTAMLKIGKGNVTENIHPDLLRAGPTDKSAMQIVTSGTTTERTTFRPKMIKIKKRKHLMMAKEIPLSLISKSEQSDLDVEDFDMRPAQGLKIEDRRLLGKLCDRSVLMPEGPKYDSKGKAYLAAYKKGPNGVDFTETKPPKILLPKCCNCCQKSLLGCQ